MTYKFITFPPGVDVSAKKLVREFVDPVLHDVRNMFLTPFGPDRNGPGGCNFPIAATLAGVLDGLNDLFPPASLKGRAGDDFKDLVEHYYPTEVGIPRALSRSDFASALWTIYRCPLAHALGRFDKRARDELDGIFGSGKVTDVRVDKGRLKAKAIEEVGDAADQGKRMAGWKAPTLYPDGTELRLTAIIFYWGVRRTVINVVAARSPAKITAPSTSSVIIPPAVASGPTGPTKVGSGSTG
ncbi:MAG: hypothetical protein IH905_15720 [Proteobacteria bacterium]|nr:hypothetical protein [Pseudomonadota bacterium]